MRKLMVLVVVLVSFLLFVPTVSAQIYDPCTDLSLHPQVRVDCAFAAIATSGYGYGYPVGYGYGRYGGYGYPSYGRYGRRVEQPMGRREKVVTGGAIGAAAGYGISGNGRGAAIGGAAGAVIGLIADSRRGQKHDDYHETSRPQQSQQPPPQSNQGATGPSEQPGPYFNQGKGEFELVNSSGAHLDVFDGRKFVGQMKPGEVWQVPPPQDRYRAEALVPNNRGGVSRGNLETQANDSGWTFNRPAVVRGR